VVVDPDAFGYGGNHTTSSSRRAGGRPPGSTGSRSKPGRPGVTGAVELESRAQAIRAQTVAPAQASPIQDRMAEDDGGAQKARMLANLYVSQG